MQVDLLEVEEATCKESRLHWAVSMQEDRFQPTSYLITVAGPPAVLYYSWSSSWRAKQENRIASEDVHAILCTKEFKELLLAWMHTILELSSFSPCYPSLIPKKFQSKLLAGQAK
jgi:hypothetical protein